MVIDKQMEKSNGQDKDKNLDSPAEWHNRSKNTDLIPDSSDHETRLSFIRIVQDGGGDDEVAVFT